jgi:dipeptidyl aminopeptidase/acylaminoacyl peptidase
MMRVMLFRLALLALALALALASCGGSRGTILNAEPNTKFVTEKAPLYYYGGDGLHQVDLDGSGDRVVFSTTTGLNIMDLSDDMRVFAWTDSDTNAYLGDVASGSVRRIPAVDRRASQVAFSPDGRTLAVSRHSDFSLPQAQWTDDDTLYFVDVATLAVTTLAPVSAHWPTRLRWTADGKWLELGMAFEKPTEWVSMETHAHSPAPAGTPEMWRSRWHRRSTTCQARLEAEQWGTEVRILEPGKPARALVTEVGRERGFHDYRPDFHEPMFTPGCANVIFDFNGVLWLASVETGRNGPLVHGAFARFLAP